MNEFVRREDDGRCEFGWLRLTTGIPALTVPTMYARTSNLYTYNNNNNNTCLLLIRIELQLLERRGVWVVLDRSSMVVVVVVGSLQRKASQDASSCPVSSSHHVESEAKG
jgi:hypothetical protein